jgi:PLP dependent protein
VSASVDNHRPAELVASLATVRSRIADAATAVGRDPWSVTLIAVTKTFPATDLAILLGLGVADFGESRDQEARPKLAQLRAGAGSERRRHDEPVPEPRVHFIGRLQTNKCRSVARYADCVHTVDRVAVAKALAEGAEAAGRSPLSVFVQVSLDGDPTRGGIGTDELMLVSDHVAADPRLRLLGVMGVAPQVGRADEWYGRLHELSARVREAHPGATYISAGMSNDFELAISAGATHVRIGSALLGRRAAVFG